MTNRVLVVESLEQVESVLRESVNIGERLVELKERLVRRNAEERLRFDMLKSEHSRNGRTKNLNKK